MVVGGFSSTLDLIFRFHFFNSNRVMFIMVGLITIELCSVYLLIQVTFTLQCYTKLYKFIYFTMRIDCKIIQIHPKKKKRILVLSV